MAVARIFVISKVLEDILETVAPVFRMCLIELHYLTYYVCIFAILRNIGQALFKDLANIMFDKCIADADCHENSTVNSVATMRHARRLFCKTGSLIRITRANKSPCINKDLSADLLCSRMSVLLNASAHRCRNSVSQVQICRMLSGNSVAAPPEETMLKRCIIQKCLSHILCLHIIAVPAILQCL